MEELPGYDHWKTTPEEDHKMNAVAEKVWDMRDAEVLELCARHDIWDKDFTDSEGLPMPQPPIHKLREDLIDALYWADE